MALCLFGMMILLTSCFSTRRLGNEEKILTKNKIVLKSFRGKNSEALKLKEELATLFKQKPNRRWLILFNRRSIFYYLDSKKNKKVLFKNTLQKIAEPPAFVDDKLISATESNMYNYMFNKGYFNVKIEQKIKTSGSNATVTYFVYANKLFLIDSLYYEAQDTAIENLLESTKNESILGKGKPIDNLLFQSEKARITRLLTSKGYAEFNPLYIQNLDADTSSRKNIIKIEISDPDARTPHKRYIISQINVYTNFGPNQLLSAQPEKLDSVTFYRHHTPFYIVNKNIARRVMPRPGMVYSKSRIDSTYNKLSKLEFYKFINIETRRDSADSNSVIHNIYLTPNNRWVFDIGADINYTSLRSSNLSSLFGVSGFALLKNRNIAHSGAVFSSRIESGAEISFFNTSVFNAINLNFNNSLTLPDFYDITGSYGITKALSKAFGHTEFHPETKTSFNLGFELVSLNNYFRYLSVNNSISYDIPLDLNRRLLATTYQISLYRPEVFKGFQPVLDSNKFLQSSFPQNRLFTSFFLGQLQYYFQARNKFRWSRTFIASLETSGLEVSVIDGLTGLFGGKSISEYAGIELSKFVKLELDHRWNYQFKNKNALVFRINYGAVTPLNKNGTVPYIRQFFMGGPQSLRAWRLREPGPGADKQSLTVNNAGNYYSSGDLKIEANIEYRFKIYWRFEGALFTDAGNIWLWPGSGAKKEGQISSQAYRQIAAGSGLGLRMDFTYFLLRLDYGMKWRNPYQDDNGHYGIYTADKISLQRIKDNSSLHLALNYPF